MSDANLKIIFDPEGNAHKHTFANAYDLLNHAGWTWTAPKAEAEVEPEVAVDPEASETVVEDETPDFAAFTKDQLVDYALNEYEVTIDKRKSQATLADEVQKLYEDHTAE